MSGEPHEEPNGTPEDPTDRSVERRESGLTANKEARLARRVVRAVAKEEKKGRFWWGDQRWPLDVSLEELQEKAKERPLTMREKVAISVHGDVSDQDKRVRRIANKTALAMDKLNQADEHREDPDGGSAGPIQLVRVVVGNRDEVQNFESIKMQQLGEIIENEPQPTDEEIEDAD